MTAKTSYNSEEVHISHQLVISKATEIKKYCCYV